MSQPQPIITEEPQPQAPPGFDQPLPGQYPQDYPPPVQPVMQQGQPMMQQGQPMMQQGQPMMQQGQPMMQQGQPMMQQGQPMMQQGQPMIQPAHMIPMQSQPSNTTNVVMINQQSAAPTAPREWSTGLCGCCDDCGTCCYAIFCGGLLLANIAERLGEGSCFAFCCRNALLSLRIKFRTEQNIQGSLWDDNVEVNCCYYCVLCQLARELDHVQRIQTR
ncbi:cell number regulator 9-like isoform X2 [Actinia tenebrosa]|uniref:Cell number regulator 9-like isoform X2 n=1 Tax=Actinia tenebrosa TaxID=6105 RepID=A0A6P8HT09_ACTTE|nr:cell number regulator 9-like isoform X2 [Actinia tenebrosa]